jgi:hypothetical protein
LEFPDNLKYRTGDLFDPDISDLILALKLSCRSKYLQNLFLLERLAIKHGAADGQTLLDIAREMLSLILLLYTNRDRFLGDHHNFEWLVSGHRKLEALSARSRPEMPRVTKFLIYMHPLTRLL